MTLQEELKARNAQPGDRVVCDGEVFIAISKKELGNPVLMDKSGDIYWTEALYLRNKKLLALQRPDIEFWSPTHTPSSTTDNRFWFNHIDPITPKRKVTIEVPEGAEVLVNGRRVEV